ncbi:hypothetical protein B5M09_000482 [Aphanomyces astaci]|uniref:Uncharacterized protein n=1 Tax=Aphanomyces astaci TaxID=112090 RepID=A0A3R7ZC93_APHAT|nr:hypothetical protein B5M09_000482 [Aphanomyces astaci]
MLSCRFRPFLASIRGDHAEWSVAECMVEFLLHFHDTYDLKTTGQSAISVLVSASPARKRSMTLFPKKATFSLMDAFHSAQSPLKKRPSQQPSPSSSGSIITSPPPEPHLLPHNNQEPLTTATSPVLRRKQTKQQTKDKQLLQQQRANARATMDMPPMTSSSTASKDDVGPLPKLKFDQADWKRTATTIKSVERGMREMRFEAQFQDKQVKIMAKVLPAALPGHPFASPVGSTNLDGTAVPGTSTPYIRALEKERYGNTKRRDCGLCHLSHLSINLPAKVSFRCIMELYVRWGHVPLDRESAKYRPPKCYDEVPICRFCEQIVQDVTWDPTFEKPFHPPLPLVSTTTPRKHLTTSSSDPYALPPLDPDDLVSSGDDSSDHETQELKSDQTNADTPAKVVYREANYLTGEKALSLKEWSVLQTSMSNIRVVMERTAKNAHERNQMQI